MEEGLQHSFLTEIREASVFDRRICLFIIFRRKIFRSVHVSLNILERPSRLSRHETIDDENFTVSLMSWKTNVHCTKLIVSFALYSDIQFFFTIMM